MTGIKKKNKKIIDRNNDTMPIPNTINIRVIFLKYYAYLCVLQNK